MKYHRPGPHSRIFDSMSAASEALGIPVAKLRRLKSLGCPGFRNSRVYEAEIRDWLRKRAAKSPPPDAPPRRPATSERRPGAGPALSRLESAEVQAFEELQCAAATGDEDRIEAARAAWLKTGDSLRKYDIAITEARRSSGQLIDRAQIEKALRRLSVLLRAGIASMAGTLSPQIAGQSTATVSERLRDAAHEVLLSALVVNGHDPLPAWAANVMLEPLADEFKNLDHLIADRVRALQWILEWSLNAPETCAEVFTGNAPAPSSPVPPSPQPSPERTEPPPPAAQVSTATNSESRMGQNT